MKPSTAWLEMAMWKLWLWHKKIMKKNRYLLCMCVFCVCLFPLLIISIGVSKKISNIGFNTETKFFKFLIWIFFLLVCFCLVFLTHAVCFLMDVVVGGSYEARMDDAVQGNTHAACRWRRFMEKVSKRFPSSSPTKVCWFWLHETHAGCSPCLKLNVQCNRSLLSLNHFNTKEKNRL